MNPIPPIYLHLFSNFWKQNFPVFGKPFNILNYNVLKIFSDQIGSFFSQDRKSEKQQNRKKNHTASGFLYFYKYLIYIFLQS